MLGGILLMGGLGMVVGIGLAIASKVFYVWVDPKVEAIDEALPGANCGGCGLPGCGANAIAIAEGKASPSSCVAGGEDLAIEIAEIMGVKLEAREPDIAKSSCTYGVDDADLKYQYSGVKDCRAEALLNGGSKVCPIGCLGLGTCVNVCPFDALTMGDDNLPVVNLDRCTGCGTCERACPKNIITLSSYSRRIQHEYTLAECSAPCQRSCPAGIDIPAYIKQISNGNYLDAVRIIKETNPFPLVCGRICVHPCEYECRRNLVDEPVAINHLKRFVADYEMNSGRRVHNPRAPETEKRVAVVGGGAEGLTAAYLLNRLGHDSVVFESSSQLGGLLRTGIPQDRLPGNVLDWEIEGVIDAGVDVRKEMALGKDFTVESLLKDGFSSVFVATGGWDTLLSARSQKPDALNALPGIRLLVDFVLNHREGKAYPSGDHVVILGGGKAALEAAALSIENGASDVTIVIRDAKDTSSFSENEISHAEESGIGFRFNSVITRMTGEDNCLTNVEIARLSDEGAETEERFLVNADNLLTGSGRFPELIYVPLNGSDDIEQSSDVVRWETLIPYSGPYAEQDLGMFRPGEENSDYKAVVEAIGAGRRAASSIQLYLYGDSVVKPEGMIKKDTQVLNLTQLEPISRFSREKMAELSSDEKINNPDSEVFKGYSEDLARKESERCLQCGLICYRRSVGSLH